MCQWITDTLKKAEDDGAWDKAFESTLGKSGADTPEPPWWPDFERQFRDYTGGRPKTPARAPVRTP